MIGVDVIDLATAFNSRWREERFLQKIGTEKEVESIVSSVNRFLDTWKLWSAKEAAFKALSPVLNIERFRPKDFEFHGESVLYKLQNIKLECILKCEQDCLQATVIMPSGKWQGHHFQLNPTKTTPSQEVRDMLFSKLSVSAFDPSNWKFGRVESTKEGDLWASVSHHGRFGAFAFALVA